MTITDYPYQVKYEYLKNDMTLAYMEEGEGNQTLLFIHGMGSYSPAFQKNMASLMGAYRCIALDMPNYGLSSKGDYTFTMDFFAETLEAFIERKSLNNLILVGHSMGAQIVLTAILKNPKLAEKIVLLAPAGFETFTPEEIIYLKKIITQENLQSLSNSEIQTNFELNFYGQKIPKDAVFMFLDRLKIKENKHAYNSLCKMIAKCVQGMLNGPVYNKLREVTLPVLTIFGKNDLLIPNPVIHSSLNIEQVALKGDRLFPKSELHLLPECGHFVQWDQFVKVNELISGFALRNDF